MRGKDEGQTDWTAYYSGKKSWFSARTQKTTLRVILDAMDSYLGRGGVKIAEFGGGNSCFAKDVCGAGKVDAYHVFDSNALSVELFNRMDVKAGEHLGIRRDLLDLSSADMDERGKYDFVYSVGLIEHFKGEDVRRMVRKHFEYCRPGGIVLITFPTPTRQYLFVRKCMELAGAWKFPDECPVRFREVKGVFEECGTVEDYFINRRLPLTQAVVVSKKLYQKNYFKKRN